MQGALPLCASSHTSLLAAADEMASGRAEPLERGHPIVTPNSEHHLSFFEQLT